MNIEQPETDTADISKHISSMNAAPKEALFGKPCIYVAPEKELERCARCFAQHGRLPEAVGFRERYYHTRLFLLNAADDIAATEETIAILGMGGTPTMREAAGILLQRVDVAARQGDE